MSDRSIHPSAALTRFRRKLDAQAAVQLRAELTRLIEENESLRAELHAAQADAEWARQQIDYLDQLLDEQRPETERAITPSGQLLRVLKPESHA